MNYYNEWDKPTAAWLRELVAQGLIPQGEVDERSITEVQPADLRGYTQCHLFAGIGGWPYALQLAGWPTDRPVWTGSCPCQPYSVAGKREGDKDERHLWPEMFRLIRECRPEHVFGEQVTGAIGHGWLDGVSADLETESYAVGAVVLGAHSVGAPHIRQRLYWMGHRVKQGLEGHAGHEPDGCEPGRQHQNPNRPTATPSRAGSESTSLDAMHMLRRLDLHNTPDARMGMRLPTDRGMDTSESVQPWEQYEHIPCADGWRRIEPGTFPLAHGIPARVVRLRGYGNAIVPQCAAEFVRAYMEVAA